MLEAEVVAGVGVLEPREAEAPKTGTVALKAVAEVAAVVAKAKKIVEAEVEEVEEGATATATRAKAHQRQHKRRLEAERCSMHP